MTDNPPVEVGTSNPFKMVADAMEHAVKAVKEDALVARSRVDQALPAFNRFVSRFVYTTCYTISYGVVFPTALVARSVPKNNPIVHGLLDGVHTAIDMVERVAEAELEAKGDEPAEAIAHS